MSSTTHIEYRPDVDGLRAIAILSVITFHAFPSALPGGFVGVDIFFVISGFLITSIIIRSLRDESFSYFDFYGRRIKRIFPALFIVLAATTLLGWLFLLPVEFKQLGLHMLAGAGFASNFVLWNESGYFDTNAELKPLLHLWSLSIEEQFYIFFPVAIAFFWRKTDKLLVLILGIVGISFLLNVVVISHRPVAVFYAPFTRIWELLVGSALGYIFVIHHNHVKKVLSSTRRENVCALIGVVAIAIAVIQLDKTKVFPGWWALLPTLGASLVIAAGPKAWINKNILATQAFVFIGLISYPLYLWHWPLLSFLAVVKNGVSPSLLKGGVVVLAFLLAWLTYMLIEKPIRQRYWPNLTASLLALLIGVIAIVGGAINKEFVSARLGRSEIMKPIINAIDDGDFPGIGTTLKGAKKERVLFIGDSFLEHYYSRIKSVVGQSDHSFSVKYAGVGGCPPLPNVSRIANPGGCQEFNDAAYLEAMKPDVKRVVFGSAWHYFYPITARSKADEKSKFEHDVMLYAKNDSKMTGIAPDTSEFKAAFADFEAVISELTKAGKRVYIVLPSPISDEFDPRLMIDRFRSSRIAHEGMQKENYYKSFSPVITELTRISKKTNVALLDPSAELCPQNFCSSFYGTKPIYKDIGHIRPYFVLGHVTIFDKVVIDN